MVLQTFLQLNKIVFLPGVSFITFPDLLIQHQNTVCGLVLYIPLMTMGIRSPSVCVCATWPLVPHCHDW